MFFLVRVGFYWFLNDAKRYSSIKYIVLGNILKEIGGWTLCVFIPEQAREPTVAGRREKQWARKALSLPGIPRVKHDNRKNSWLQEIISRQ